MKEILISGGAENAHQTFTANLGGKELTFRLDFMTYVENPAWNLDISMKGETLVCGLLLKCGVDLLKPYHLGIGKLVMVGDEPTLQNLGVQNSLVWIAEDEEI